MSPSLQMPHSQTEQSAPSSSQTMSINFGSQVSSSTAMPLKLVRTSRSTLSNNRFISLFHLSLYVHLDRSFTSITNNDLCITYFIVYLLVPSFTSSLTSIYTESKYKKAISKVQKQQTLKILPNNEFPN